MRHSTLPAVLSMIAILALSGQTGQAADFVIAKAGKPMATILLARRAGLSEVKAAEELTKYVRLMTGAQLDIVRESPAPLPDSVKNVVVVAGRARHESLERLENKALVDLAEVRKTPDAFVIKSVRDGRRNYLVLAGNTTAAPLYAVYDLLERFGRVGFFRHKEHVPKREDFVIPAINLTSKPYFKHRMFGGQIPYFGYYYMDEEGWKREVEWLAKNRVNLVEYLPVGYEKVRAGWKAKHLGVRSKDPWGGEPRALHVVGRKITAYAMSLGVNPILTRYDGLVDKAFEARYPKARYFSAVVGGRPERYIYADDPLFMKMQKANFEEFTRTYGKFNYVWAPDAYAERLLGNGRLEEKLAIQKAYGVGLGKVARTISPDATWVMCSWAFNNKTYWPPDLARRMFNSIPRDTKLLMVDLSAETSRCYEDYDYWFGREWLFAVLNSYAFDSYLHGDAQGLIDQVDGLLKNPKAAKMTGFGMVVESRDYTPMYMDLVLKMCWNPRIKLDDFLADYVARRYEPASGAVMLEVHRLLCQTVYGPDGGNIGYRLLGGPFYFYRLGEATVFFDKKQIDTWRRKEYFPPKLRKALQLALTVAENEKGNWNYKRDVIDIGRSYLQAIFNLSANRMYLAFKAGDREQFERHASTMELALRELLTLVSTLSDSHLYCLKRIAEKMAKGPFSYGQAEARHWELFCTPSGGRCYFYHRIDRWESLNDVYLPRVQAFIRTLRTQMDSGSKDVPKKQLARLYDRIEENFIRNPLTPVAAPSRPFTRLVTDMLSRTKALQQGAPTGAARAAGPGPAPSPPGASMKKVRGVYWKRMADGKYGKTPYCPRCRSLMTVMPPGNNSSVFCPECNFKADFSPDELESVHEKVETE